MKSIGWQSAHWLGVRKTPTFETALSGICNPIPLATGCMGHCHYCYLQTTLGARPYIRADVNLEEIFSAADRYMQERAPETTRFEAACTSDPVGIEHLTGSLKKTIEFIGNRELGRLRFVTNYANVDSLLDADHRGHTRFRFSINADYMVNHFEPAASPLGARIEAAKKVAKAKYPLGFVIAPIMLFDGWKEQYDDLLQRLAKSMDGITQDLTFELITHRFTKTAKNAIKKRYPKTKLDWDEEKRKKKWGKYGRVKYVYPDEQTAEIEQYLSEQIQHLFLYAKIIYFT